MSEEIKKAVKEIQQQNGNINFTQKELIWYTIHKLEKVECLVSDKVDKKFFYWFAGIAITIFLAFAGFVVQIIHGGS